MDVVHEHEDILQNIEAAVMLVYRKHPRQLIDADVRDALNVLIKTYSHEGSDFPLRLPKLSDLQQEIVESVQAMCEWRLGRKALAAADGKSELPLPPADSVDVIVACLRRLVKSVDKWEKQGGRQGYLTFVSHYVK